MLFAATGQTAAELVSGRANALLPKQNAKLRVTYVMLIWLFSNGGIRWNTLGISGKYVKMDLFLFPNLPVFPEKPMFFRTFQCAKRLGVKRP